MTKVQVLSPASGIAGRYATIDGHYKAYRSWRRSDGYKAWLKRQWSAQKGRCFYCKTSLKGRRHNVEHVTPQSRWGATSRKNMVLACPGCNKAKGNSMPSKEVIRRAATLASEKQAKKVRRSYARMKHLEERAQHQIAAGLRWIIEEV